MAFGQQSGPPASGRQLQELKGLLDELGIAGFPKTTGNRGLHVYVRLQPRWDSYEVRSAAVAAAREALEETGVRIRVDRLAATGVHGEIVHANGDRATYLDLTFACTWLGW